MVIRVTQAELTAMQANRRGKRKSAPKVKRTRPTPSATQWRCHQCGETFTAWARAKEHGHNRLELIL